jgi:GPI mannosyltransferase 2
MLVSSFLQTADQSSYKRLLCIGFLVRLGIWLALSISDLVIPDFVSGDDSLVDFSLRLEVAAPSSERANTTTLRLTFATRGCFCDCGFSCTRQQPNNSNTSCVPLRRSRPTTTQDREVSLWRRRLWSFLLNPLTRWDSARFLRLAHRPTLRYPQIGYRASLAARNEPVPNSDGTCPNVETLVRESEEAHAFLPLFPLMVQILAWVLQQCLSLDVLPPTCESLLVLAAWILNTLSFLWAASELYTMTLLLLQRRVPPTATATHSNNTARGKSSTADVNKLWARRVVLLFLINPATVFWGLAYSEALGAALVFTACRVFLQHGLPVRDVPVNKPMDINTGPGMANSLGLVAAALVWWLACWVRSNASLYSGALVLYGLGRAFHTGQSLADRLGKLLLSLLLGVFIVAASIACHNYNGFRAHCLDVVSFQSPLGACQSFQQPSWCERGRWFNVYSYVQQKYWNVGFLKYYEWKQIPNFLLATPVLVASVAAVSTWIRLSWKRYLRHAQPGNGPGQILQWATTSLVHFSSGAQGGQSETLESAELALTGGPLCLGHYAVLAASTILCATVAHVQISTRVLFSTCPALYWFLVVQISKRRFWGQAILLWCLTYTLLGIVMHPNWLPWT